MLFYSTNFIFVFLPVVFFVYYWLNKKSWPTAGTIWLASSSLFFYGWWNPIYLILISVSILVNYWFGKNLGRKEGVRWRIIHLSRNYLMIAGLAFNLGLLGYYKYYDFFLSNLDAIGGFGFELKTILLPLGISFFTFTQIAYLVDCYREGTKEYDLLNYILFVTFFPHLIAGPILHHKEMMPQFYDSKNHKIKYSNLLAGCLIFSMDIVNKVVIADSFSHWANYGFDQAHVLGLYDAWITSLSYTFQLYFDFSGYTDMAIGIALLFNIRLPENFNSPYKALSIQDFWHRWHMTLSRFLRDYLYIPLGGNRNGHSRTYLNLAVTFLLGGLWHGASWMFVIWGAMHGLAMVVHSVWGRYAIRLPAALAWLLTFNFVNLTWVFFRAKDMKHAKIVIKGMLGLSHMPSASEAWQLPLPEQFAYLQNHFSNMLVATCLVLAMLGVVLAKNSTQLVGFGQPVMRAVTNHMVVGYGLMTLLAIYTTMAVPYRPFFFFHFL